MYCSRPLVGAKWSWESEFQGSAPGKLYTGDARSGAYRTASGELWARDLSEVAAWDVVTGQRILRFKPPQEWEGNPAVGPSADGRALYSLHNERRTATRSRYVVCDAGNKTVAMGL